MAKQMNKVASSNNTDTFFKKAEATFNRDEMRECEIESLDFKVYFKPLTFGEQQEIFAESKKDEFSSLLHCFIIKSLDADGNRLFDLTHKKKIMNQVDPMVIIEVSNSILGDLGNE